MTKSEQLARATVRIECGEERGSGFHFIQENIIVTNQHVIGAHAKNSSSIKAITELNEKIELELLASSPEEEYDFAILKATSDIPPGRTVLEPKTQGDLHRGSDILFSGFPHGIHNLLVHQATISGPDTEKSFYIDGMVNGGNSGGPIVDPDDFKVVGIITRRRFLGGTAIDNLNEKAKELREQCQQMASRGSAVIMGINFSNFAQMMAESLILINQVVDANANSGIGIGFKIKYITDEYNKLIKS